MTRRLVGPFLLVAVLAVAPVATANTVTINTTATGDFLSRAGNGGPFVASTTGALLGSQTFITFCLEFTEYFTPGQTYNFTLSDAAVAGGNGQTCVSGNCSDPLSAATRWLYYHAATHNHAALFTAAGISVASGGYGAAFQNAIWFIEAERTASEVGGTSSAGYLLAQYALANQNWETLYNAGHRVWAMNLTDASGSRVQDQLAYGRVPEPGSLLVLGLGFLGVGAMLRRRHD